MISDNSDVDVIIIGVRWLFS